MDWSSDSLYSKAKLYAQRANDEPVDSALFGLWMSLSLELLARAALAQIHPALLADPKEPDNIQYAFGIIPKNVPEIHSSEGGLCTLLRIHCRFH